MKQSDGLGFLGKFFIGVVSIITALFITKKIYEKEQTVKDVKAVGFGLIGYILISSGLLIIFLLIKFIFFSITSGDKEMIIAGIWITIAIIILLKLIWKKNVSGVVK